MLARLNRLLQLGRGIIGKHLCDFDIVALLDFRIAAEYRIVDNIAGFLFCADFKVDKLRTVAFPAEYIEDTSRPVGFWKIGDQNGFLFCSFCGSFRSGCAVGRR